ncbi:MAG: DUF368 domain-containing protein [Spirochaetaceae bacterium]|nr:DUF368 domain-containing protein [Spirochaetaceae bacterium]
MKNAFFRSPGPDTGRQALVLALKGFCMGCADLIPGVSGGSVAFILGIYPQLLTAIRSFDLAFVKRLFTGKFSAALEGAHLRFLLILAAGILTALFGLARVIDYFLSYYKMEVLGLFFGLMVASIYVLGRSVKWRPVSAVVFAAGTVSGWILVGLVPATTPNTLPFLFCSSAFAICAMILPGISGSFILFVLGKYEFLIRVLKAPFAMNGIMGINNAVIILVFACGIVAGLAAFSRFLRWLLARAYNSTLAFLVGIIGGSLRRIWPWKGEVVTRVIEGKEFVVSQKNVLPDNFGGEFFLIVGLMIAGVVFFIALEALARKKSREEEKSA